MSIDSIIDAFAEWQTAREELLECERRFEAARARADVTGARRVGRQRTELRARTKRLLVAAENLLHSSAKPETHPQHEPRYH
jgi:hypothetical protein